MARYNSVTLYGLVKNVTVKYEGDIASKAYMTVNCMRRKKAVQNTDGLITLDTPLVFTGDPALISQMSRLNNMDMVIVKGVLKTKIVTKTFYCTNCSEKVKVESCQFCYVRPIAIKQVEKTVTIDAANNLMAEFDEMSNTCQCIGRLCRDIEYYAGNNITTISMLRYQIAINRQFRDTDDEASSKTDYPYVITRGKQADRDSKALHKNSLVFINGSLETRNFNRNLICPSCGSDFAVPDKALQLVPYRVEYLEDCILPETTKYKKDSDNDTTEEDI